MSARMTPTTPSRTHSPEVATGAIAQTADWRIAPKGERRRRIPAHVRCATITSIVHTTPGLTAGPIATLAALSTNATLRYLRELEAQRVVVSVLETPDEAWQRVMQEPASTLSRRYVRRKLRWTRVETVAVAA